MTKSFLRWYWFIILFIHQAVADTMPEAFPLSVEAHLEQQYPEQIVPFWQQHIITGNFTGVNNITIEYAYVINPDAIGSIVISSGRIETLLKYKEVIYDLYHNGYSVFINDHRGQGLSGRMIEDPQRGYVDNFNDYVDDLKQFYTQVVQPHSKHKPKLLCHSMGGAIGALYVLRYPDDFSAVAFSSPMFGIKSPLPDWLGTPLISSGLALNGLFSDKSWYFIGQTDYLSVPFAVNTLSHSKLRYKIFRQEYENTPQTKLGGVTFKWLDSALSAIDSIHLRAAQIALPTLVLQAGNDIIVDNKAQNEVCDNIPHCAKMVIEGANHELLMEKDQYRIPVMNHILTFFQGH